MTHIVKCHYPIGMNAEEVALRPEYMDLDDPQLKWTYPFRSQPLGDDGVTESIDSQGVVQEWHFNENQLFSLLRQAASETGMQQEEFDALWSRFIELSVDV